MEDNNVQIVHFKKSEEQYGVKEKVTEKRRYNWPNHQKEKGWHNFVDLICNIWYKRYITDFIICNVLRRNWFCSSTYV